LKEETSKQTNNGNNVTCEMTVDITISWYVDSCTQT